MPGIAFWIGASIDEVGGKIPKTFIAYLPQEWSDTSLPDERVTVEADNPDI